MMAKSRNILFGLVIFSFIWIGHTLLSPTLPQQNNPIILYSNETRDDLRLILNKAIKEARESILVIIYSLRDKSIIHNLKVKSEKGVDVKVICDAKASGRVERKLGSKVNTTRLISKGIMHLKILVIDHKMVWIGSANMTTNSLRLHSNLVAGIYCPELAKVIHQKGDSLGNVGLSKSIPPQQFDIAGQPLELWFLPDNPNGTERIQQLIKSAKKTIKVAMFTWTRMDFAQRIIEAAERGVEAEIIIDHNSGRGVSAKVTNYLKNNGIPTSLSRGTPLFHHKCTVIDNSILILGSANWTKAAFTQNDDCFIILHNLKKQHQKKLKKLWNVIPSPLHFKRKN